MSLKIFLDNEVETKQLKMLPIFHTTRYSNLEPIYEDGIKPIMCDVMHKALIYLFYGRGVYLKESKSQVTINDTVLAVSLGFNLEDLSRDKIFKIFPFDSGAFNNGRYNAHIDENDDIENYSLDVDQINKYIEVFFDFEENYIKGKAKLNLPSSSVVATSLHKLLKDTYTPDFDMRARAIEISYSDTIKLDSLKLIVVHERHSNNAIVKDLIQNKNVKVMTYDTEEVGNERDIYTLVISKVREYVKKVIRGEVH